MKRIWIAVGILLGMLAVTVFLMRWTERQLEGVADTLQQAAETRDWDRSRALTQTAREDWQKNRNLLAALVDHGELEKIDDGFAQLEVYGRCGEQPDHGAICAQLVQAVRGLFESHQLTWWNLL